jgi:DNA-binding transcriptional ArsR family regulator
MSESDMPVSSAGRSPSGLSDLGAVVAISHPVRRRLIEALRLDGPATVSQLAAGSGELVGNVSHHLKVLHRAGMIEEAPELAKDRRERWWRFVPTSMSWSVTDFADEPASELVALAAEEQNLAYHTGKVRDWFERRTSYEAGWREAAFAFEWWVKVTPAELIELRGRISAVIEEFGNEHRDESQPREDIYLFARGFPGRSS